MAEIAIPLISLGLQVLNWALQPKQKPPTPKLPSSDYGRPIPRIYGKMRVGVNWIGPKTEAQVFSNKKWYGKGGGGNSNRTQEVFMNICGVVCEGPVTLKRLKVNNVNRGDSFDKAEGSVDQLPDFLTIFGSAAEYNVGYRKLAYVIFNNFPLADFGNAIPNNVTAEVYGFYYNTSLSKNGNVKVKDIIQDIIVESGIDASLLINNCPDSLTCYGAIANRNGEEYYQLLSQFLRCYDLFIKVDDWGKLVVAPREQTAIALSINKSAFCPISMGEFEVLYNLQVANDDDMPGGLSLEFFDINSDYDRQTVQVFNPNGNIENNLSITVDIVLDSSTASTIALNILMRDWLEKKYVYRFKLYPQLAGILKVGDLVEILPEGVVVQVAAVSLGNDYTTEIEAFIYQNSDSLTPLNIVVDERPLTYLENFFDPPPVSYILDSPLISDSDEDFGFYFISNKQDGVLYQKTQGQSNYEQIFRCFSRTYQGVTLTTLGAPNSVGYFDRENEVVVQFSEGEIDQQTLDQLYQLETVLFIGQPKFNNSYLNNFKNNGEFFSFLEAELIADNTYRLKYLRRNLYDFSLAPVSHPVDSVVVVMRSPFFSVDRVDTSNFPFVGWRYATLLNKFSPSFYYRDLDSLTAQSTPPPLYGEQRFPPVPMELRKYANGDLVLIVCTRARKYGELSDVSLFGLSKIQVNLFRSLANLAVVDSFEVVSDNGYFEIGISATRQLELFGESITSLGVYAKELKLDSSELILGSEDGDKLVLSVSKILP